MREVHTKEIHSADGSSYIIRDEEKSADGKWRIVFKGEERGGETTREKARAFIRRLKEESKTLLAK